MFQKTLGVNDFYFASDDCEYPLGNIQMVGKSQAPMFRGEKPGETRWRPTWTLRDVAAPRRRLLAVDRGPAAARQPRHARAATAGSPSAYTSSQRRGPSSGCYQQLKSMLGAPRHAPRPPAPAPRLPQERDPGRRRAPTRRARAASATDPATSVLDADCRAHEVDNLYVVDTSFFPSIGAVNPALTAMANALRVGDHLLERLGAAAVAPEAAHVAAGRQLHVVVVGGGFAGVGCARRLAKRRATCASRCSTATTTTSSSRCSTRSRPRSSRSSDIAFSLRKLFRDDDERRRQARPRSPSVDPATRTVTTADGADAHRRRGRPRRRLAAELLPHAGRRGARLPALLARRRARGCARASSASSRTPTATRRCSTRAR